MGRLFAIVPSPAQSSDIATLVSGLEHGDRAALTRLLTLAGEGQYESLLTDAIKRVSFTAPPVVAFTGSAGVGKSSLLGAVVARFAGHGERIGVLACDPSSPLSGGALLGDRCRIADTSLSERVFIRSLATESGQQGVAPHIALRLNVMQAFGFDRIFIETVGTGQGDVAVHRAASVVVLVVQPQTGDALQWEKAGILEIADILVVNKFDLPGGELTLAQLLQQVGTREAHGVPVVATSVARREGIEDLCLAIEAAARRHRSFVSGAPRKFDHIDNGPNDSHTGNHGTT